MGISIWRVMPSENNDTEYCLLEAPDAESVAMYHSLAGIKCEDIQGVNCVAEFSYE